MSSEADLNSVESEYLDVLLEERAQYKEYFEREKDYRRFVYDTYTKVPENVAPRLKEELEKERFEVLISSIAYIAYDHVYALEYDDRDISEEYVKTVYQSVQNCKEFLERKAYYSLEPGVTPDDVDFIDYFLYDNQKGYCSHFATAAVIYLRLCGVPARYVEGYKILSDQLWKYGERTETEDYTSFALNITDENAHAWVEVYINGVGWMPVDVTPGFGTVSYDSDSWTTQQEPTQNTDSSMPPTTLPPTPSIQASENTSKPIETNKGTQVKDIKTTQISSLSMQQKLVVAIVLFVLMILISILVRKEFLVRKHKRIQMQQENNTKAKYYYYQVNKMVRSCCYFGKEQEIGEDLQKIQNAFSDITLDDIAEFINIVEKASFGSKEISDNECMKVRVFYENVRESLYRNTSFIKKLYYKTWKVY